METIAVSRNSLTKHLFNILNGLGACDEVAKSVANGLVTTSMRGTESHGINLFPHYINSLNSGVKNGNPRITCITVAPGITSYDADGSFGLYALDYAIEDSLKKANEIGICFGSIANSTHCGALFPSFKRALDRNYIGIGWTNADSLLVSYGGRNATLGTNPILIGVKADDKYVTADMATSIVPWNKIRNAAIDGVSVNEDWGVKQDGSKTKDAREISYLNAMGTYKGYALAFMFEILTGVLSGGPIGKEITPMFKNKSKTPRQISQSFILIKADLLNKGYQQRTIDLINMVKEDRIPESHDKNSPKYPGEVENINMESNLKNGYNLDVRWISRVNETLRRIKRKDLLLEI